LAEDLKIPKLPYGDRPGSKPGIRQVFPGAPQTKNDQANVFLDVMENFSINPDNLGERDPKAVEVVLNVMHDIAKGPVMPSMSKDKRKPKPVASAGQIL